MESVVPDVLEKTIQDLSQDSEFKEKYIAKFKRDSRALKSHIKVNSNKYIIYPHWQISQMNQTKTISMTVCGPKTPETIMDTI